MKPRCRPSFETLDPDLTSDAAMAEGYARYLAGKV